MNGEAWAWLGSALADEGRPGDSNRAFRNAIRFASDDPAPYLAIARVDQDVNMVNVAIGKAIQKVGALEMMAMNQLQSEDGTITSESLARVSSYSEALEHPRRQLDEALELLSVLTTDEEFSRDLGMLIEWYPHSVDLKAALATRSFKQGRFAESMDLWRAVLDDAPGQARGHIGLARCQESMGQLAAAAVSYRRALGLEPENGEIYEGLRTVYRKLGNETGLREMLVDRTYIDSWNPVLLETLIALENDLGMHEIAESRIERLNRILGSR